MGFDRALVACDLTVETGQDVVFVSQISLKITLIYLEKCYNEICLFQNVSSRRNDRHRSFPPFQIELESWDSWGTDDPFNPVRGNAVSNGLPPNQRRDRNSSVSSESEPDTDYFQDMQPEFRRTAKVSEDGVFANVLGT